MYRAEILHGCKVESEDIIVDLGEPSRFKYLKSNELLILMADGVTLDMFHRSKLDMQISNPNINALNIYPYTPYVGFRGCLLLLEKILGIRN